MGGGVALFRAAIALDEWKAGDELELAVKQSMTSVLEESIGQLIENAKRSRTHVLEEIRKSPSPNGGFNAATGKIEELLVEAGIVDSASKAIPQRFRLGTGDFYTAALVRKLNSLPGLDRIEFRDLRSVPLVVGVLLPSHRTMATTELLRTHDIGSRSVAVGPTGEISSNRCQSHVTA